MFQAMPVLCSLGCTLLLKRIFNLVFCFYMLVIWIGISIIILELCIRHRNRRVPPLRKRLQPPFPLPRSDAAGWVEDRILYLFCFALLCSVLPNIFFCLLQSS